MCRDVLRLPGRLAVLAVLAVLGCGGDDDSGGGKAENKPISLNDGGNTRKCVDKDRDTFGDYCDSGDDCDDDDPEITDECIRCVSKNDDLWLDCPCEPGTEPLIGCTPKDKKVVIDGISYIVKCSVGTRYCRDGFYSDCEFIDAYVTMTRATN